MITALRRSVGAAFGDLFRWGRLMVALSYSPAALFLPCVTFTSYRYKHTDHTSCPSSYANVVRTYNGSWLLHILLLALLLRLSLFLLHNVYYRTLFYYCYYGQCLHLIEGWQGCTTLNGWHHTGSGHPHHPPPHTFMVAETDIRVPLTMDIFLYVQAFY